MAAIGHRVVLATVSSIETRCDCSGIVCIALCLVKTEYRYVLYFSRKQACFSKGSDRA